jgi:hypothetical protein
MVHLCDLEERASNERAVMVVSDNAAIHNIQKILDDVMDLAFKSIEHLPGLRIWDSVTFFCAAVKANVSRQRLQSLDEPSVGVK